MSANQESKCRPTSPLSAVIAVQFFTCMAITGLVNANDLDVEYVKNDKSFVIQTIPERVFPNPHPSFVASTQPQSLPITRNTKTHIDASLLGIKEAEAEVIRKRISSQYKECVEGIDAKKEILTLCFDELTANISETQKALITKFVKGGDSFSVKSIALNFSQDNDSLAQKRAGLVATFMSKSLSVPEGDISVMTDWSNTCKTDCMNSINIDEIPFK